MDSIRNNLDRIVGACFALLSLIGFIMIPFVLWGFVSRWWTIGFSWSGLMWLVFSVSWPVGLGWWARDGWENLDNKIEVGWRGQILFLGGRLLFFFEEGRRWVPKPFGVKVTDCRETILKLNTLDVFTSDPFQVEIDGTVVYRVIDIDAHADVKKEGIQQGIDDLRDEALRTQVAELPLSEVLKMHAALGKQLHSTLEDSVSERWGIKILKVVIAGIRPDPKVIEDMELRQREMLQTKAQEVEYTNFLQRVRQGIDAGLTGGQAYEQSQITLGKAAPKVFESKIYGLDPATVAALIAGLKEFRS